MLLRYLEIAKYYSVVDGLLRARSDFPLVNFRWIVSPSEDVEEGNIPLVSKTLTIDFLTEYVQRKHQQDH